MHHALHKMQAGTAATSALYHSAAVAKGPSSPKMNRQEYVMSAQGNTGSISNLPCTEKCEPGHLQGVHAEGFCALMLDAKDFTKSAAQGKSDVSVCK